MRKGLLLFLLFCLAADKLLAQSELAKKIEQAYTRFAADEQMQYASISLTVLDAQSGEVLFAKNEQQGLAPASTLKTITSATALYLLGPNFTYKTSLTYTGSISKEGILSGDIILVGGGDPSLGSWRYNQGTSAVLTQWLNALKQAGIKKIQGKVVGCDSLYGAQITPDGWIWQDIGNYYGAGATSLSWHENQLDVYLKPSAKVGDLVKISKIDPAYPYLQFINEIKTGPAGSGDKVYAYAAPYSSVVYLRGTYGIDWVKPISPAIPDPAFDAAYRLADTLRTAGIELSEAPTTWRRMQELKPSTLPSYQVLHTINSPKLTELVFWFNRKSINLYGENLLKALALDAGKPAETQAGVEVVKAFWKNKADLDPHSLNISDGSGLSPANRVTTLSMAKILQSLKKESWFAAYHESLPTYNGMKMKSGSIADVLAYAGYQRTAAGKELVFSFMVNNYHGNTPLAKKKMYALLDQLK
jgi:D-alanyl-D-alanine carboxypeptidase/D-alanyl-D-alanine-endopeptidase (penicillin-binding protein 4)